jgi:hypothetical protein
MRRRAKYAVIPVIVVAVLVFFLVPVSYWFTVPEYPTGSHPLQANTPQHIDAYRSLGCVVFGIGDSYYTAGDRLPAVFELSCQPTVYS